MIAKLGEEAYPVVNENVVRTAWTDRRDALMTEDRPITCCSMLSPVATKAALNHLIPLVYAELRKIADGHLRNERPGHTLQPTALVHEAYARLIDQKQPDYRNRVHFLAVAAQVMRQILIDHARKKFAAKRGGSRPKFSLDEACDAAIEKPSLMIDLDDALKALEVHDAHESPAD